MRSRLAVLCFVLASACVVADDDPFPDHDEASDLEELPPIFAGEEPGGVNTVFDRHAVIPDAFLVATEAVDGDALQAFFEDTPYGTRSWLADAEIDGVRAADAIVTAARAEGLNPVVMVTRMQVEKSLVSATVRPKQSKIDFAFGCGCPDGQACNESFRGLDKQVTCAARTLRRWYDASIDGSGSWRKGVARRTLDPITITPTNHATATLYAYTPWVLSGRGGNWLVWNVTRRYVRHLAAQGGLMID